MMKPVVIVAALAFALCSVGASPAAADCAAAGDACRQACETRLGGVDQDAGRAGCVARCVTDKAACVAQSAVDEAARTTNRDILPWIDRQTDRARSMIEEFWRRNPPRPNGT